MITTSMSDSSSTDAPKTDAELMGEICSQKGDALERLFRKYVRLAYRVAVGILNDRAEAEDITQEIFLEVYRKAHLYDPSRGSVRVWLLQYVYHRTLRRKAALGRRAAYRGEPLEAAEELADYDGSRLTPDECRWVLRTGLAQLPERQRTTLELSCFEDLPLRDVAERLGVSVGCTRHYYYRGLARLQQWARVTEHRPVHGCRSASRGGTAGAATAGGRQLFARI
jgi:RNA polymerase sigma-70 factor, ECF subfamily